MITSSSKTFSSDFVDFVEDIEDSYMFSDICIKAIENHRNKEFTTEQLQDLKELNSLAAELVNTLRKFESDGKVKRMMELLDKINNE